MDLNQWFDKAMSTEEYINGMEQNKEELLSIQQKFEIPDDQEFFNQIKNKNLRAIVLTEDWCGDAMLNIPILLRIAEKANIEVRMLLRDSNLELMDQYLTNGKSRAIPIFIFIDEAGNEVAKWGPRAPIVQKFVDDKRNTLPPQEDESHAKKAKAMYKEISQEFQSNTEFWKEVYLSIKESLLNIEKA